jgi:sec-independent protein translocase protein TatB
VFGVGFQEMLLIGLLFLVLFGPKKLPQMARDLGRFASKAQHVVDEFKTDLMSEVEEDRKSQRSSETRGGRELEKNQETKLRS